MQGKASLQDSIAIMTNTKQLQAVVAFLVSIAILDNFIFIEQDVNFESTVLVEHKNIQTEQINGYANTNAFLLDQDNVSSVVPAAYFESSHYRPQTGPQMAAPSSRLVFERRYDGFTEMASAEQRQTM